MLYSSHKLEYFKPANWENEWVTTAEGIVRTEFERAYANIYAKDSELGDERSVSSLILLLF